VLLHGCSGGQSGALPSVAHADPGASGKLQLAVGTATIGVPGGGTVTGLNTVATFRQPGGQNAALVNTPTLSGPAIFDTTNSSNPNVFSGVLPSDLAAYAAAGNTGSIPPGFNQFGPLVGVFGYGFAADNLVSGNVVQTAYSSQGCFGVAASLSNQGAGNGTGQTGPYNTARSDELPVPLFATGPGNVAGCGVGLGTIATASGTAVAYYGGPPAWPSPQGYNQPNFFAGYPLGFTDFATDPVAGTYQLDVSYPTASDYSSYGKVSTTAVLPQSAIANPLPPFVPPTLQLQIDGSATIDITVPPGVSEAIINVVVGACANTGSTRLANYYSLLTKQPGHQTLLLSSALGPPDASGKPTPTFCATGGGYTLQAVGFDYPAFEASYPQSHDPAPAITNGDGHTGTADITTAPPQVGVPYVSSASHLRKK